MGLRRIAAALTGRGYRLAERLGLSTRASRQGSRHRGRRLQGVPPIATALGAPPPLRVLLLGNGLAESPGVEPAEPGFAEHLARSLSAWTGRGVQVRTIVGAAWDLPSLARRLHDEQLRSHDVLIVTAAYRPELAEVPLARWQAYVTGLKATLIEAAGPDTAIRILSLPWRDASRDAPEQWGGAFGNRVVVLAEIAESTLRNDRHAVNLRLQGPAESREWIGPAFSAQSYQRWADQVAADLAKHLGRE